MSAYISVMLEIDDPDVWPGYGAAWDFQSFTHDYGGEIIMVSDDDPEVIEGAWSGWLVIMRLPDAEKARGWYESAEYREVRKIRWASATSNLALHQGANLAVIEEAVNAAG